MINGKDAWVEEFALHHIGGGAVENTYSDYTAILKGDEEQVFLRKLFLKPFSQMAATAEFAHPVGLEYNVLYNLSKEAQAGRDLVECSVDIAKHLVAVSRHYNIKGGDLYVARLNNVGFGDERYAALGIYKFEEKEVFIQSKTEAGKVSMWLNRGVGGLRPNKACLIVFTQEAPTVFVLDDNDNTDYWQKDFVGHRAKRDHVNSTSGVLELTKSFITEHLPQEFETPRADQIDLLNRSVQYFKDNAEFDRTTFVEQVFEEQGMIEAFDRFGKGYKESNDVAFDDNFAISSHAVKRQARVFKSVLKLDKNFHIYIHGDRSRIEQGVDERTGRKFYKIYYDQEA
ncbi:MAG: nucleoid-associated protein [Flavobacteriales bacterium]|nr:nucleoid-associated protein [Flavobacteriales bacterium]